MNLEKQIVIVNTEYEQNDLRIGEVADDGEICFQMIDQDGEQKNVYMKATKGNLQRLIDHFKFIKDNID